MLVAEEGVEVTGAAALQLLVVHSDIPVAQLLTYAQPGGGGGKQKRGEGRKKKLALTRGWRDEGLAFDEAEKWGRRKTLLPRRCGDASPPPPSLPNLIYHRYPGRSGITRTVLLAGEAHGSGETPPHRRAGRPVRAEDAAVETPLTSATDTRTPSPVARPQKQLAHHDTGVRYVVVVRPNRTSFRAIFYARFLSLSRPPPLFSLPPILIFRPACLSLTLDRSLSLTIALRKSPHVMSCPTPSALTVAYSWKMSRRERSFESLLA